VSPGLERESPDLPSPIDLPPRYAVEGLTPTEEGLRPVRIGVDRESGLFVEPEGLELQPLVPDSCWLLPGFLDLHVHCRDDPSGAEHHKEDYTTASAAALHGGVVAVADMPNNPAPPVDPESYARKQALVAERASIEVVVYGAVSRVAGAFRRGIPWKCYFGPSVGELHDAEGVGELLAGFRGEWVAFHAEDPEILEASRGAAEHEDRRPPEAERVAVARILELARQHGFRPHIAHLSTAGGLAEIEAARSAGLPVTCEVAPHHLFFDRENRGGTSHSGWLQMNPPLRTPEDRRALIEGLRRGAIDIIATDHAPHSIEENERGISGVPLLDTFAPFLGWLAEEEGFDWAVLVERAARRPAEIFRDFLPARYGALEVGCSAGFVVLDPESPWTVRNGDIRSRAGWSPFEGHTFPVSVVGTAVGGEFRMFGVRDREA